MRERHTVLGQVVWIRPLTCPVAGGFIVEIPGLERQFVAWYIDSALWRARALIAKAAQEAA